MAYFRYFHLVIFTLPTTVINLSKRPSIYAQQFIHATSLWLFTSFLVEASALITDMAMKLYPNYSSMWLTEPLFIWALYALFLFIVFVLLENSKNSFCCVVLALGSGWFSFGYFYLITETIFGLLIADCCFYYVESGWWQWVGPVIWKYEESGVWNLV